MALIKTRNKLVDVARQLFAKRGLDNTTMNDIAAASGKGRRTLYTYFKSKEDSLDPYFVSNLNLAYSFRLPHTKKITAGVTIYNLFNKKYENNGYSQTVAVYPGGDKSNQYTLVSDPRFYPMAGTNVLGHLTFRF